tara:strand:- start:684 stop:1184 length:501 start_codon:yes stop_codon:yes gene_type:complete
MLDFTTFKKPEEVEARIRAMAKNVIDTTGLHKGIEVHGLSSDTWEWESGDGEYRLANLNAIGGHRVDDFLQALEDRDITEALNCGLTFRVDTESDIKWGDKISFKAVKYTSKHEDTEGEIMFGVRNAKLIANKKKSISISALFGEKEEAKPSKAKAKADDIADTKA